MAFKENFKAMDGLFTNNREDNKKIIYYNDSDCSMCCKLSINQKALSSEIGPLSSTNIVIVVSTNSSFVVYNSLFQIEKEDGT